MFDDTVYAYEFALANMELSALANVNSVPFGLPDGIVELELNSELIPTLVRRLAYVEKVADEFTHQKYLTEVLGAVKGNHGKGYMTHWMYPYKAKFHPQMIRAFLNIIGAKKGDTVLDPMTGSGTVNVEAKLMGIDSIGIDCLPIGVLASKVKCNALETRVGKHILQTKIPKVKPELSKRAGEPPFLEDIKDVKVRDFFKLLFFETLSIARLPKRSFPEVWDKMLGHYLATVEGSLDTIKKLDLQLGDTTIELGDARHLKLSDESISHILTSPPYAIAIDYVVRNTDQLGLMGYSTEEIYEQTMGLRGKGATRITNYYSDLALSIKEMFRVLKKGGNCVIVIGDTQYEKQTLPTISRAISFADGAGFKLVHNVPKVSAGRFGLFRSERILVFQKA